MSRPPLPRSPQKLPRRKPPRRRRLEHARSGRVALAYTVDSDWRNRAEFVKAARTSRHSSPANGAVNSTTA